MEELTINDVHDVDAEETYKVFGALWGHAHLVGGANKPNQTIYVTGMPLPLVNPSKDGYKKLQISSPDFTYLHSSQLENL